MADTVKQIKDYLQHEVLGDEDLLLVQASGTTYALPGRVLKAYAVQAAASEAVRAETAADAAASVASHPPLIDESSGYWLVWSETDGAYVLSSFRALGRDFTILGYYDTLELLKAAVPSPTAGMTYGIGTAAPYDLYVYDAVLGDWRNNGPLTSTGDMTKSVYDPNGHEQDIFAYVNSAIGGALEGSY